MNFSSLALLTLLLHVAIAAVVPTVQQLYQQTNVSDFRSLLNATTINPPIPTPGFRADVGIYKSQILNPKGYMLSVVKLMRQLSELPWDNFVQREGRMTFLGVGSLVHPFGENMLRTSHAVLGLRAAAQRAAEEILFYATWTNISINGGDRVGELGIVLPSRLPPEVASIRPEPDISTNLTVGNVIDSGTIDLGSQLQIKWQSFDTRLPSMDMFSAVVEGLAMVAPYADPDAVCDSVPVISPASSKGQVVIDINRSPNLQFLSCRAVRISLEVVFESLYVTRNSWTTLDFDLLFMGRKIGHGDVLWLPF